MQNLPMTTPHQRSPQLYLRIAGLLYPAIIALGLIVKGVDLPQWARRRADALA